MAYSERDISSADGDATSVRSTVLEVDDGQAARLAKEAVEPLAGRPTRAALVEPLQRALLAERERRSKQASLRLAAQAHLRLPQRERCLRRVANGKREASDRGQAQQRQPVAPERPPKRIVLQQPPRQRYAPQQAHHATCWQQPHRIVVVASVCRGGRAGLVSSQHVGRGLVEPRGILLAEVGLKQSRKDGVDGQPPFEHTVGICDHGSAHRAPRQPPDGPLGTVGTKGVAAAQSDWACQELETNRARQQVELLVKLNLLVGVRRIAAAAPARY